MEEREFWVKVRRGLLLIVDAIGERYDLPRSADLGLNATLRRRNYEPSDLNGTTRERASSQSTSIEREHG